MRTDQLKEDDQRIKLLNSYIVASATSAKLAKVVTVRVCPTNRPLVSDKMMYNTCIAESLLITI
jgi:hypothetical protein